MTVAGGTMVKNPSASAGDARYLGSIPGWRRSPGEGNGNPFLPGKSHGQRSLVDYSPWGGRESDMTVCHVSICKGPGGKQIIYCSGILRRIKQRGCLQT